MKLNNNDKQNEEKIPDEFDSDNTSSIATVATKSNSQNIRQPDSSPVSIANEIKHFLSPNYDHSKHSSENTKEGSCNETEGNKINHTDFMEQLTVSYF